MKNDYNAENVAKFMSDFVKHEEYFDATFFERLSCMFTTLACMCDIDADTYACDTLIIELWEDINATRNLRYTSEDDYDEFYNMMIQWIV